MITKQAGLILALFALTASTSSHPMDGKVYVLDAKSAQPFVEQHKYVLLYGYVPGAEVCARVDAFVQRLAARLESLDGAKLAKVDIKANMDVQRLIHATYLPHIALFVNGLYKQFEDEIDEESIFKWVEATVNTQPSVIKVASKEENEEFLDNEFAVGIKHEDGDAKAENILEAIGKLYPKTKLYRRTGVSAAATQQKFEMLMVRKWDEGNKVIGGERVPDVIALQRFFEMFRRPYVLTLSDSVVAEVHRTRKPTAFIFDKKYDGDVVKSFGSDLFMYKQKIVLVQSTLTEGGSDTMANVFAVEEGDLPVIGILDYKFNKLRKFRTNIGKTSAKDFIDKYFKDELSEHLNGEPVPTENAPVRKVVRENFHEVVNDESKHVVVGIYSDSCSYCAEMHEAFDKAKKELRATNDDISFVKLNLDKNDVEIAVKGMPAIFLYKKGQKSKPVEYPLIRDYEVLLDWLEGQIDRRDIYAKPMPEGLKAKGPEIPEGYKAMNAEDMQEL